MPPDRRASRKTGSVNCPGEGGLIGCVRLGGRTAQERGGARRARSFHPLSAVASTKVSETPRNAPCPCGSGRKFKRCCAATLDDPAAISRKHDQVGARIQAWAFEHYDAEVQAAVQEIMAGREDAVLGAVDLQLVASWILNDRELPGGGTASQRYAARQDLQPDERDIAARIAAARLGLLRVLRVMPGRWIELHDLTGDDDLVRVISHGVSRSARPGVVLVGRLMDGPPAPTLWGPVGFLDREPAHELAAVLKTHVDSLGPRAQPAGVAGAMHAASREITVMLSPALRNPSPRRQAA